MANKDDDSEYQKLIEDIGEIYQAARSNAVTAINIETLHAYWKIGKNIIKYEQGGSLKAEYGKKNFRKFGKRPFYQTRKGI